MKIITYLCNSCEKEIKAPDKITIKTVEGNMMIQIRVNHGLEGQDTRFDFCNTNCLNVFVGNTSEKLK